MQKVCSPYFDPEFDSLSERINGPTCRVSIDNDSLEDCTVVKIDSVNKQGLLLEVVQVLTDVNLTITKGYISSDAGWFMDVFHVKDDRDNKVTDQRVINYIEQGIGAKSPTTSNVKTLTPNLHESSHPAGPTAIEMTGTDRPGLFSEISAALADLHCNVVEAHAWSHNARLACVAYISVDDSPINGSHLAAIEHHLTTVLRATAASKEGGTTNRQEAKTAAGLPEGTTTVVERRLHQLLVSVRDFDGPTATAPMMKWRQEAADEDERNMCHVWVDSCEEKGYSIVTIKCRDRKRLMFDTVCTLTDMHYVIFHASVDTHEGYAFQEYFIRHVDGRALNTESEKERVMKCLEAAIERRVSEGIRLELCANNRVGLLSDITRVLRESGLIVVRADIATQGEKAMNAFYVRDISGNTIDMEFLEVIKRKIEPIHLAIKNEPLLMTPPSSPGRSRFSISDMLKCQIERFSHNFVTIKGGPFDKKLENN